MSVVDDIDRIALLNFGGIGDEVLFSPVIQAVREAYPDAHLTLILESRSGRIRELLPQVDNTIEIQVQGRSRKAVFWKLLTKLRARHFDVVISSGSSPFIPALLALSGIPIRVGFQTGKVSKALLTSEAPLDRKAYAGDMYFSLARAFLKATNQNVILPEQAVPQLAVDTSVLDRARRTLAEAEHDLSIPARRVLIHPGVSRISVEKNILKAWPISHWEQFLDEVTRRYPDTHFLLVGGPDDREAINALETCRQRLPEPQQQRVLNLYRKKTSLRVLAGLISVCDVMVSVDSAPLHIAIGLKVPVLAIFCRHR